MTAARHRAARRRSSDLATAAHEVVASRRAARTARPGRTRLTDASTGTARLLEGGPIAAEIRAAVAEDVAAVHARARVGRPASPS